MSMIPGQARKDPNDTFDYDHAFAFALERIDPERDGLVKFINSLRDWYEKKRFLTEKQKGSLFKVLKGLDFFDEDPASYY